VAEGSAGNSHTGCSAADLLREAGEDVIAHMAFLQEHWRRIHATDVLARLHREIKRHVVGIFLNAASALRLVGVVFEEQGNKRLAVRRYFSLTERDTSSTLVFCSPCPTLRLQFLKGVAPTSGYAPPR